MKCCGSVGTVVCEYHIDALLQITICLVSCDIFFFVSRSYRRFRVTCCRRMATFPSPQHWGARCRWRMLRIEKLENRGLI